VLNLVRKWLLLQKTEGVAMSLREVVLSLIFAIVKGERQKLIHCLSLPEDK
jgi:hypothetical protein